MEIKQVSDILTLIYEEIKDKNTFMGKEAVPLSSHFFPYLARKYRLLPHRIPVLMDILVNVKMVFSLPVAEIKEAGETTSLNGYVLTKGDLIVKLRKHYEQLFEHLYTDEFQRKMPVEKLILEFSTKREEYNNTPIGIVANITTLLAHYQSHLERNILKFAESEKEKALAAALLAADSFDTFVISGKEGEHKGASSTKISAKNPDPQKNTSSADQLDEIHAYTSSHSLDRTLKLYGIELYTRACFREYQFSHLIKVIEDGHIKKSGDLKTVKRILEKERMNSDRDMKINEYANDINTLMKCINEKLRQQEQA